MIRKLLLALAFLGAIAPAQAQNVQCSNRTAGDSTNACANTRFVTTAIAAAGLSVGVSPIVGGANTRVLFDNAGILGEYVISGSGNVAMTTNPVFTTPNLGTPSAVVLTNATGTASGLTAGTATNAVNSGITDDTATNASMFPTWVTATGGNAPLKTSSTKLYFNPSIGRLSVSGTTSTWTPLGTTQLFVQSSGAGEGRIEIDSVGSDSVVVFGRLNNSFASSTVVASGDQIMGLVSQGIDTAGSTTMQQGGALGSFAGGTWSSTSHPTDFRFFTIATASTSLVETARFSSTGAWVNAGTLAPNLLANSVLQLQGATNSNNYLTIDVYENSALNSQINFRTARGTPSSFTGTLVGDSLGGFAFLGATGANTFLAPTLGSAGGAFMITQATENWDSTHQGTNFQFYTTPTGGTALAIGLTIQASGGISAGSLTDKGAGTVAANGGFFSLAAAKTLVLKQGANGSVGTFVCNGVTAVTVNNTNVAISDAVIISLNAVGGTVGAAPDLKTITAATGFTVACTAADTSTYNYAIIKNAA